MVPYAIDSADYTTIRQAYHKIRLLNARAKHVVCAYSIKGTEKYYCNDFVDDNDHGVGKALLDAMISSDVQCKAVYIVRYCGAEKLGKRSNTSLP